MSNYFDNQDKWSWQVSDNKALLTTDHGSHTHTLDVTKASFGDMVDHTGEVMGDAHRAASHDFKVDSEMESFEKNSVENDVSETIDTGSTVEDDGIVGGVDCEDGLDI